MINTYFLARVWTFLTLAREFEAKTSNNEEELAQSKNKKRGNSKNNRLRNFEIATLIVKYEQIACEIDIRTLTTHQIFGQIFDQMFFTIVS